MGARIVPLGGAPVMEEERELVDLLQDSAPRRAIMGEEEQSDFELGADDSSDSEAEGGSLLAGGVMIEHESCWFRACLFPCSNVAMSSARTKAVNQGYSVFPALLPMVPSPDLVTHVDFSRNLIAVIPEWLGRLVNPQRLYLGHNRITHVAPCVYELTRLTHLSVPHNRIAYFSRKLLQLT